MFDIAAALEVVFWVSLASVFYAYAGYPVVIRCLAALAGRRAAPPEPPADALPRVSLLIAAYNEASIIAARIENALAMDYPADRREIVVATDGCSDGTAEVVRGVRLLEYTHRRGKSGVLNDSIPRLTGEEPCAGRGTRGAGESPDIL